MTNKDTDNHKGFYARGYLPHFDEPGLFQSITFRLVDSISPERMQKIRAQYQARRRREFHEAMEDELDRNYGKCWLRRDDVARVVARALQKANGKHYRLIAWVIMPNHIHCIIHHAEGYPLSGIVRNWKADSAIRANRILRRTGKFWQPDYFDRYIRDPGHLDMAWEYIHFNPVAAGLCRRQEDWQWSSIHEYMAQLN
ncbi:transposase [bacterium]|nr:transposase [bacterium]